MLNDPYVSTEVGSRRTGVWRGKLLSDNRSAVSDSATPRTIVCQAPLSMGIFRAGTLEWVAISFSKWGGKKEVKRTVLVRVLKTMRSRGLTENMEQERSMFLFFKAPAWHLERTGPQAVTTITRLLGLAGMQGQSART